MFIRSIRRMDGVFLLSPGTGKETESHIHITAGHDGINGRPGHGKGGSLKIVLQKSIESDFRFVFPFYDLIAGIINSINAGRERPSGFPYYREFTNFIMEIIQDFLFPSERSKTEEGFSRVRGNVAASPDSEKSRGFSSGKNGDTQHGKASDQVSAF